MSTTALEISKAQALQQWKSPVQIKARITAIQQLLETTLKQDVDFGVIPGTGNKPTLYKAGSEQILAMFQIAVDPMVEDLSTDDCFRYRVTVRLTNSSTQEFLGSGIGEASSNETKYKWRRTYVKKEFDNTPEDRRRIKYGQRKQGNDWVDFEEMQVRQEPADLANTILKMAKKRAQIDATLTVTGASSMFEQDLEDLTDEAREEVTRQREPRGKKKGPVKETGDVMCNECRAINGHLPSCKYRKQENAQQQETSESKQKPQDLKWLVSVEAVDERKSTQDNPKDPKNPIVRHFLLLTCINAANETLSLYCWHTGETATRIKAIKPKTRCIFTVKPQPTGNKTYYSIESIVEITGEQLPIQGEMLPPDDQPND